MLLYKPSKKTILSLLLNTLEFFPMGANRICSRITLDFFLQCNSWFIPVKRKFVLSLVFLFELKINSQVQCIYKKKLMYLMNRKDHNF